jgi:hypothetical protein
MLEFYSVVVLGLGVLASRRLEAQWYLALASTWPQTKCLGLALASDHNHRYK